MSEITRAVIGMPFEMAMENDLSRRQFHSSAQALLAENKSIKGSCKAMGKDMAKVTRERNSARASAEKLKAENAGLKTGYEAYERVNAELRAECEALRKRVEDMSPFKGAPKGGQHMKCLACGDYHYGLSGLPCPKMSGVAYSDINPDPAQ